MLHENRQVFTSHRDAVIEVWCVDATMRTLQEKSWPREVGIVGFVRRVQNILGRTIAMEKVLVAANHERALGAEDSTA